MKLLKTILISFISVGLMAQQPLPTQQDIDDGNISDEEKIIMENFEHTGHLQRDYEEKLQAECSANGKSAAECNALAKGRDATQNEKFMGMSPTMMKGVAQAYTMVIGMTDLGSKLVSNADGEWNTSKAIKAGCGTDTGKDLDSCKETNEAAKKEANKMTEEKSNRLESQAKEKEKLANKDGVTQKEKDALNDKHEKANKDAEKKEDEEMEDYCRFVAMGTETIAMFQGKSDQDFIAETPSRTETAQVVALQKQSRAHGARARNVNTQVVGWGATTACYTAMMIGPASVTSWQNYLKLGASMLMWRYYDWEKGEHEKAKGIVDSVAAKLKGAGDCNPVSDRDCYCSQPETMNDVKFCMPQIRARTGNSQDYQLSCVNENLQQDPQCQCVADNTCLDKTIRTNMESMHIPATATNNLNPFFEMTKGVKKPGSGQFSVNSGSNKLFAVAKGLLRDNADKVNIPLGKLSKDQTEAANKFVEMGLPLKAAKGLASMKLNANAEKNLSKFKGSSNRRYSSYRGKRYKRRGKSNTLRFSGGKGISKSKSSGKSRDQYSNFLKKFGKKGKKGSKNNSNVLKFAEKASRSAQITKDKSEDIFRIISRRYQVTARKRLDVE
ncbi:MAG: hypothetical protein BM556_03820 [Bacteriovorax sp. MedPE-SWde]|nr:MAG: hypothetical protein BM556_03820 [Bacteriovorax sp. MedPE-SWde]